MKKTIIFLALQFFAFGLYAQKAIPTPEVQIKTAVLAAPAEKRNGATVYGYNQQGDVILLRKGSNDMICLADDPKQEGFSASCYHQELEPFMARGRELKKQGKGYPEITDTREAEVKAGKLKMPKQASTLFVFFAPESRYNATTGDVQEGNFRYVVYIPYATAESTALPLKPEAPGMPWIMDPGTHKAHIMINPPIKE